MTTSPIALETKDVSFRYAIGTPFEKTAVDQVSFTLYQGEFLGLIGHTGSGKSTLIQMLNGLLRPTSGGVFLEGKDIWAEPKKIREVRFHVGMVFQYPEYQLFEETVEKDIMFGPLNMGLTPEQAKEKAKEAAYFVGLPEALMEKSPFELSGGEKRRVAIAGVIAMDPKILILDEPTAGLDPQGRDVLLSQIHQYHKSRGNTVVLVSHSMEDIGRTANRLLVMRKSKKVMLGETKEIFSRGQELKEMGLQVPQITQIMDRLRQLGCPGEGCVLTVEDAVHQLAPFLKARAAVRQEGGEAQ